MNIYIHVLLIFSFILLNDCRSIHAQDADVADSLKALYIPDVRTDSNLIVLSQICSVEANPDSLLKYSELLIQEASLVSNLVLMGDGYMFEGHGHKLKGDLDIALESYLNSIDCSIKGGLNVLKARVYISIADLYSDNSNSALAATYYKRGFEVLREGGDSIDLATALLNAGDEYFNIEKYDSALMFTVEAEAIFNSVGYTIGQAYSLGNMGMNYAQLGNNAQAEINLKKGNSRVG